MPENHVQMTGALRLAKLRAERDQIRAFQPSAVREGAHPRSDVFFLLDTIGVLEMLVEVLTGELEEGPSDV